MAALFDLDDQEPYQADPGDEVGQAFGLIVDLLLDLPARSALRRIESFRGVLDASESRILAGLIGDDGNTRRAESAAGCTGRTSKKTRKRKANRAKAVKANKTLADKMAAGDMTDEQVDVIAAAANKTDGAAALDEDLIDKVAATDPDQGAKVADDYVTDHTNAGQAQSRHDRQRAKRCARRFVTDDGLDAVLLKGATETIDAIWSLATSTSRAFYTADGGRDVASALHPRTSDQRLFDAFVAHITGSDEAPVQRDEDGRCGSCGSGRGRNTDAVSRGASEPACAIETATSGEPNRQPPIASKRFTPAQTRPLIVVGVTLEKFLGLDPDQAAELIGVGPIADSVRPSTSQPMPTSSVPSSAKRANRSGLVDAVGSPAERSCRR